MKININLLKMASRANRQNIVTILLVMILLLLLFYFAISSSRLAYETNKHNFAYNMIITNYLEALDEIFQRSNANIKIFTEVVHSSYDINRLHDEAYNKEYVKKIGALSGAILKDLDGGYGSWFQINNDLPFSVTCYNWYVKENGKVLNYKPIVEKIAPVERELTPEDDPYYFAAIKTQSPTWSDVYIDVDNHVSMISLSAPIYKQNKLIGVVGLDISMESLKKALKDIQQKFPGSEIFLLDKDRDIIASQISSKRKSQTINREFMKLLLKDQYNEEPLEYFEDGTHKTAVVLNLQNEYKAVISFPNDVAFSGFGNLFASIYITFAFLIAVTALTFMSRNKLSSANQELELQANKFREVFNEAPSIMIIKSRDGKYIDCNDKYLKLFNMEKQYVIGKNAHDLYDKKLADHICKKDKLVETTRKMYHEEVWEKTANGENILLSKTRVPLFDSNGKMFGILINAVDTTQKAMEKSLLLKAKEDAEKATMMKSSFLANMSHEIRTPLNGVLGFLQILEDTNLSDEQREYINDCKKASVILLDIINEILDFSKIEAGKIKIDKISFDVRSVIEDVISIAMPNAAKNVEIYSLICSDVPSRILGDPGRVKQILNNLIGNSVKFTDKGSIIINVNQLLSDEDRIVIQFIITDTGIGISPEQIAMIFESFTQADASSTRKYGGTGLGLSISQQLAKLMDGIITVDSTIGVGSTFTVTLPFEKDNSENITKNKKIIDLKNVKILLISDNSNECKILGYYLKEANSKVIEVHSYKEALEILNTTNHGISLILVDDAINNDLISDDDGNNLATLLDTNENAHDIPLILCSQYATRGDALSAKEKGFSGFLTKPFKKTDLLESVSYVLSGETKKSKNKFITKHLVKEYEFDKKAKILVVEDSAINCKFVVKTLTISGLSCDIAINGKEAIAAFMEKKYDLIFMDCQMPILDGYDATTKIRDLEKENSATPTPIIALTAHAFQSDKEKCLDAGMDDYLSKPIDTNALLNTVAKYIKFKLKDVAFIDGNEKIKSLNYKSNIINMVIEKYGFNEDEAAQMYQDYLNALNQAIADIDLAIEKRDMDALKHLAHRMKGTSASMGFEEITQKFKEIEAIIGREDMVACSMKLNEIKDCTKLLN